MKTSSDRLLNCIFLLNLEIDLGENILGAKAITVFNDLDLEESFSKLPNKDNVTVLLSIANTIVSFNKVIETAPTAAEIASQLKHPIVQDTINQILTTTTGTITKVNFISKQFIYPTVVINNVEIPIVFLKQINEKKIKFF